LLGIGRQTISNDRICQSGEPVTLPNTSGAVHIPVSQSGAAFQEAVGGTRSKRNAV